MYFVYLVCFYVLINVLFPTFTLANEVSEKRPNLTLSNFFSEGWKFTDWEEPAQEPDQAPRFKLLKIPAPVFEREVRMNYSTMVTMASLMSMNGKLNLRCPSIEDF